MNFYHLFTSKIVSIAFDNHNTFLLNTVSYALIKSAELSTVEVNVNDQSLLDYLLSTFAQSIDILYPS